jgi:Ca2+-binding EF-hand superfamily protein
MDVLKQKWYHWFNILDVNHDGMITRDDVDHTLKGLTEKEGAVANKIIEKWWNTYILNIFNKIIRE